MVITQPAKDLSVSRSMANVLVTALGWDLKCDVGLNGGFWFKARDGNRAEVIPRIPTVIALVERGLFRYGERDFPTQDLHLTPIGRLIALDLKAANP